jgi:hypothetical protein
MCGIIDHGSSVRSVLGFGKKTGMTPQLDEDGNPIIVGEGSKSGSSKTATLEDLMKRLKVKGKKATTYSSSSKDGDSSCEEEVSKKGKKGKKKHNKPSYNSMSFNYNNMPSSTAYTVVPVGKAPRFDGTNYNQ